MLIEIDSFLDSKTNKIVFTIQQSYFFNRDCILRRKQLAFSKKENIFKEIEAFKSQDYSELFFNSKREAVSCLKKYFKCYKRKKYVSITDVVTGEKTNRQYGNPCYKVII